MQSRSKRPAANRVGLQLDNFPGRWQQLAWRTGSGTLLAAGQARIARAK